MSTKAETQSALQSEKLDAIFCDCLFRDGEDRTHLVRGQGVTRDFGFHSSRLEEHASEIGLMLKELPEEFQSGGGWSFLNACMDKEGRQWGEHQNIEQLLALGCATGQAKVLLPREMWHVLPGGMPYFCVLDTTEK